MDKKVIIGGVVAGVVSFFLGYLVWGMLLNGFYEANFNQCMALAMEEMKWASMILFNLSWGFTIAIILSWAGTSDFMGGAVKGAIFGFFVALSIDLSYYAMTSMFVGGATAMAIDIAVNTVFVGLIGGITSLVMSKV
jgi:hypothetical protein